MIYEIMYIIPSKYSDSEVEGVNQKIVSLFEKHGAKIEKTQNLGKIKLAYPIQKERYGTYMLVFVEMNGELLDKLDQDLRLSEEVMRHLVVKREHGIPQQSHVPSSYVAPLTPEGKRSSAKPTREDQPKQRVQTESALSTEELDKKLDEILESDIVSDV